MSIMHYVNNPIKINILEELGIMKNIKYMNTFKDVTSDKNNTNSYWPIYSKDVPVEDVCVPMEDLQGKEIVSEIDGHYPTNGN